VVKTSVSISAVAQIRWALSVLRSIPVEAGEKITMPICDGGRAQGVDPGGRDRDGQTPGVVQAQRLTVAALADAGARAGGLAVHRRRARADQDVGAASGRGVVPTLSSRR
jgi:hypothetical protein